MFERIGPMLMHQWSGRYSLPVSFWVFGIAGTLLFWGLGRFLLELNAEPSLLAIAFAAVILTPYQLLCAVGIWRSAARYPGSRSYAVAAKLFVVVYSAYTLYGLMVAAFIVFLETAVTR